MSRGRPSFYLAYALFLLVLLEVVVRGVWAAKGVSALELPIPFHRYWYPELVATESRDVRADDETFDVLLLGGSVLQTWDLEKRIRRTLEAALDRPTRTHNVSEGGHTSLDSAYKYARLTSQRFDAVVFYHAINEARANLCPPELFRTDYSHYSWYRLIRDHEEGGPRWLALPYTLHFARIQLAGRTGLIPFVPKHWPGPEWLAYGADVKTGASFRRNLERIASLAAERGEPLFVGTFATYLAPGYSQEKFEAGELDYAPGGLPVELWGSPANVVRAVEVHNGVIRSLAEQGRFRIVDVEQALPRGGDTFTDICHLTEEGDQIFADRLSAAIREEQR